LSGTRKECAAKTVCPYGWKCPADSIKCKYGGLRAVSATPLYEIEERCYACRGLLRGEFQQFITVRCPPWVPAGEAALKLLNELARKLAETADALHLRAVIVISVGKVVYENGKPVARKEPAHLHILVGAKERVGNIRIPAEKRIGNLMRFSRQELELLYKEVFGGLCDRCIDVEWIRYDEKRRSKGGGHGRGKFRLRAYIFKQLVPKQYRPVAVGMHIKRTTHETPSTDESNRGGSSIRVYSSCCGSSGGLGGYGGPPAGPEGIGRWTLLAILRDLYDGLTKRYMYADLRVGSDALFHLLRDVLRKLIVDASSSGNVDVHEAMTLLYTMYLLVDTWNRMAEANRALDYRDLNDEATREYVENYGSRLSTLLGCLQTLHKFSEKRVADIVRNIAVSLRTKLENILNGSCKALGVDAMTILDAAVRLQIISKKKIKKLVRDILYAEAMIDGDIHSATILISRIGRELGKYIEYSWRRLKNALRISADERRRVKYGSRGSRELQFVTAVKSLIKQIKSFKDILEEMRGLENIQYLDSVDFSFEAKEMLNNAFPCFLFAGRVVCVDVSDLLGVIAEAEEVAKYATSFCRFCLGVRVKPPVDPCFWSNDDKCFERFCSLYNELLEIVNGYRELLKKLRNRLRGRAKMRKRRYRQRLKELVYELSKTRSLSEYITGGKEDPFTRAINAFNSWLRKRGYMTIQSFSYDSLSQMQKRATHSSTDDSGSAELYSRFIKLLDYVNGWSKEPGENRD